MCRNANPAEERNQQEMPAAAEAEETKGGEETKQEEGKYAQLLLACVRRIEAQMRCHRRKKHALPRVRVRGW